MKFEDIKFEEYPEGFEREHYSCEKNPNPKHGSLHLESLSSPIRPELEGVWVSVVTHRYSHGGEKGRYEIGVFNNLAMVCPDLDGWGDTVKGWLREEHVVEEINRMIEGIKNKTLRFKAPDYLQ
jgi:hypothetical protein